MKLRRITLYHIDYSGYYDDVEDLLEEIKDIDGMIRIDKSSIKSVDLKTRWFDGIIFNFKSTPTLVFKQALQGKIPVNTCERCGEKIKYLAEDVTCEECDNEVWQENYEKRQEKEKKLEKEQRREQYKELKKEFEGEE